MAGWTLMLLPLGAWPMMSTRLHWIVGVLYALAVLAILARLTLRVRRDIAAKTTRIDAVWPAGRSGEDYTFQLRRFMDGRGWLLGPVTIIAPDRLLLTLRRDRRLVALLCLRTGAVCGPVDLTRLDDLRREQDALAMVVVAESGAVAPDPDRLDAATPIRLRYRGVDRLDEVLGRCG